MFPNQPGKGVRVAVISLSQLLVEEWAKNMRACSVHRFKLLKEHKPVTRGWTKMNQNEEVFQRLADLVTMHTVML